MTRTHKMWHGHYQILKIYFQQYYQHGNKKQDITFRTAALFVIAAGISRITISSPSLFLIHTHSLHKATNAVSFSGILVPIHENSQPSPSTRAIYTQMLYTFFIHFTLTQLTCIMKDFSSPEISSLSSIRLLNSHILNVCWRQQQQWREMLQHVP
jgi:hypothetical protein